MRLTVIKPDQAIYIDDVCFDGIDLSDSDPFHAIQYDTESGGVIEFSDRNEALNSDDDIETKSGISLAEYNRRFDVAKTEYENANTLPSE